MSGIVRWLGFRLPLNDSGGKRPCPGSETAVATQISLPFAPRSPCLPRLRPGLCAFGVKHGIAMSAVTSVQVTDACLQGSAQSSAVF